MAFYISGFSDEIDPSVDVQFSLLNKLGIEYFECRGVEGKNVSELSYDEVDALVEKMKKYGIKCSSVGSPCGKTRIDEDWGLPFTQFQRVVDIAKKLKTKYIRIFSFYLPEGDSLEKWHDEVIKRMKEMVGYAEKNGVILLHENEKGIYGESPEGCAEIFKAIKSDHLKGVFDPANFVQCGHDTKHAWELVKDNIAYMHIKDALKSDRSVVPAGYGDGNVEYIITQLYNRGYDGFVSLEPHLGTFAGLANLELSDEMMKLNSSTPDKYELAYNSLKNILDKVVK